MPIKQAVSARKRRIRGQNLRGAKKSVFERLAAKARQRGVRIGLKGRAKLLMVDRRRTLLGRKRKKF